MQSGIIPNTTAVPQELTTDFSVIIGTQSGRIFFGRPYAIPKIIHVGFHSVALDGGSNGGKIRFKLQRAVDNGEYTDVAGQAACRTVAPGEKAKWSFNFHYPYYTGIVQNTQIEYRIVGQIIGATDTVTLHISDEPGTALPSTTWKSQPFFEGDAPVIPPIDTWVLRTPATSNNWTGATNHNDLIIVCGRTGTGDRIMTSPDGITWTSRSSDGDFNWRRLTTDGSIAVAVATGGEIMTSPDGITWTRRTPPREVGLNDVCHTGTAFIAVSANLSFPEQVYRSLNGVDWSLIDQGELGTWFCCASDGAGKVVALSSSGGEVIYSTNHGASWSTGTIDSHSWQSVTHDGTQFIAVADDGYITTSATGASWITKAGQLTYSYCEHIYHANDQTLVMSSDKSGSDCAVSVDGGDTWDYITTPTDAFWNCLTSNDERFICAGNIGVMTADLDL